MTRTWAGYSASRTGCREISDRAQDYVQETFIRAFQRLGEFRGESALSTWLCSIAISITLNGLRKIRRSSEREVVIDRAPSSARATQKEAEPDLRSACHERSTICLRGTGRCS